MTSQAVFPVNMSRAGVMKAIREAYQSSQIMHVQQGGGVVRLRGKGGGMTIDMWFNKATNTIETAYPK